MSRAPRAPLSDTLPPWRLRDFAARFIPAALLTIAAAAAFLHIEGAVHEADVLARLDRRLDDAVGTVREPIAGLVADVLFIRYISESALASADLTSDGWRDALAARFTELVTTRPHYQRLRLLDARGEELVRVERTADGHVGPVAREALQDKSRRPYVAAGLGSDRAARVSHLELTQEQGAAVVPWAPTVRATARVKGRDGMTGGLVVINLDATTLLEHIRGERDEAIAVWLANDRGYWLVGPREDDAFGADLPQRGDRTVAAFDPALAAALALAAEHQVQVSDGAFAQARANALGDLFSGAGGVELAETLSAIVYAPASALALPWRVHTLVVTAALLALLALVSHLMVNARRRREQVLALLRSKEQSLEDQVHERTLQLEAALRSAEAANRAKTGFLAAMSHEIRTPMNAILGMSELLGDSPLSGRQASWVGAIRRSGATLMHLIEAVLDFSRIEADRLEVEAIPFALRQVLDDLVTTFGGAVAETGVELVLYPVEDAPDALVGDPFRLGQVLANLVGNAFKFTPAGEIQVRVRRLAPGSGESFASRGRLGLSKHGKELPATR